MTERTLSLLAPGRIGTLETHNRIVLPGMGVFLGDEDSGGCLNEEQIAHWTERARGGAGLVFAEVTPVMFPVGATTMRQPGLSRPEHQAGFAELAARVHRYGSALGVQLVHHGKVSLADAAAGRPLLVPSAGAHPALANDLSCDMTPGEVERMLRPLGAGIPTLREASEEDLAEVIEAFGAAASRARQAGVDCVEVHAAHGYLISSFLSRAYNVREDRWGGSPENRARLLREVIRSIKTKAGTDYPVTVRLDGREHRTPDGITLEEACLNARLAVEAGADAIHVSAYADPTSGVAFTDGPIPWREGQYVELAAQVKRHVGVPVIAVGRIDPAMAEKVIAGGSADFVAMGRQLLADPELPNKLRRGAGERIRPCINCFVCVATPFFDEPVSCSVNPHLGRQATTPVEQSSRPRRVVVVGGGPAGLECAATAARRGHDVVVLEASGRLGGTALLSGVVMPLNAELVRFLEDDARSAGADIRTGQEASPELVTALRPDVVVVATGAARGRPDVPGVDLHHVWSGNDLRSLLWGDSPEVLRRLSPLSRAAVAAASRLGLTRDPGQLRRMSKRWLPLGRSVVVIGGGIVGLELAEFLAERRRDVTVLEEGDHLAPEMAHPRRSRVIHELREHGVSLHTGTRLLAIERERVRAAGRDSGELALPADTVVLATGTVAGSEAARAYRGSGAEVHVIGDAAHLGYLHGAIRSGFDLARSL
jgi:2,4-dienoyl-CoA reductase-like NADH-dependent reductase (Old Yellow Enzyme family)/thioredoxin reductase